MLAVLWPRLLNTLQSWPASPSCSPIAIALPLGIWAAARPRSRADYLINLLCFAGISTPPFWLALLLITLFAVKLGWLPAGGMADIRPGTPWPDALGRAAPLRPSCRSTTLVLVQLGGYTRFMRGAMIEALRQDYIRTARAKGAARAAACCWGHAFGNALAPVLTILASPSAALFSGALITETMFAWPGMGKAIYQAHPRQRLQSRPGRPADRHLRHHGRQPAGRPRASRGRSARVDRAERMSDSRQPRPPGLACA